MAAGAVCMAGAARMAEVADGPVADMLMDPTVDMAVGMVACPTCLRMFGFLECCVLLHSAISRSEILSWIVPIIWGRLVAGRGTDSGGNWPTAMEPTVGTGVTTVERQHRR